MAKKFSKRKSTRKATGLTSAGVFHHQVQCLFCFDNFEQFNYKQKNGKHFITSYLIQLRLSKNILKTSNELRENQNKANFTLIQLNTLQESAKFLQYNLQ